MFRSTHQPRRNLVKVASLAAAALLAGVGYGSSAYAASTRANPSSPAREQAAQVNAQQCKAPTMRDDWWLGLDPFVAFSWAPPAGLGSELRYVNSVEHQLDNTVVTSPQLVAFQNTAAAPRISLVEKPDFYVIHVNGKGVGPSNVKVDVQGQRVTVRYDKDKTIQKTSTSGVPGEVERFDSRFAESMQLGSKVQQGQPTVQQVRNGVEIVLVKAHGA